MVAAARADWAVELGSDLVVAARARAAEVSAERAAASCWLRNS